jgi:hypothetical protein
MDMVVGLFDYYSNLDWAVEALENYGVDSDRISLVALDKDTIEIAMTGSLGAADAASDAGLVGLLAGLSAFVVPGVGPVIATGTLASALFVTLGTTTPGARLQDGTGGLFTVLIDLGFSREDAEFYVEGVKQGGILVCVETDLHYEYRISSILRGAGAMNVSTHHQTSQDQGWTISNETKNAHHKQPIDAKQSSG